MPAKTWTLSEEALFRFRIVSLVLARIAEGHGPKRAVRLVAKMTHQTPKGARTVSRRQILRWLDLFHEQDPLALEPKRRDSIEGSRVLPERFLDFLVSERTRDPHASIPEMIRRARLLGHLDPLQPIDRSTVFRTCRRMEVSTRRLAQPQDSDTRRFAYEERLQMVLADFKHFRAGPERLRRGALYLLDDATRFGLGVRVATSEQPEVFLWALFDLLTRYGRFDCLFVDQGSAFVADDVAAVMAKLGIPVIFGTAGYPQGHGKIERFNRSAAARLLRSLSGAPDVDPDLGALTLRLAHDLFEVYNHLPHESLDGRSPEQAWIQSGRPLLPVPSGDLTDAFTLPVVRQVTNDHVVPFEGVDYEVPRGHAGKKRTLYRRLLENALYIEHKGELVRLHPVDPAFNARDRRARRNQVPVEDTSPPAKTASTLSFENTYGSMLAPDGGFDPEKEKDR